MQPTKMDTRPILITGSHRSGSSWVGRMLASAPRVAYPHEPFNINPEVRICRARFRYWFTYVCAQNEQPYLKPYKDMLSFSPVLMEGLKDAKTLKRIAKQVRSYGLFLGYRAGNFRPLVKDPIASFSVEWLADTFDCIPVVLIRHPAAFAASLRVKGWRHPFSHFTAQPALMEQFPEPFAGQIREFSEREHDILEQAALLWNLIHQVIWSYQNKHREWIFIRHEDLSRDPETGFASLFERLGLRETAHSQETIRQHSSAAGGSKIKRSKDRYPFYQRDSARITTAWKQSLSPDEIRRLRESVEAVSSHFYAESDW
jgi:LPS sulfotransferase NodH